MHFQVCALKPSCFLCPQSWKSSEVADLFFEANLLLWSVVVGILTYLGIMSAFAPLMMVLGPLAAHVVARIAALPMEGESIVFFLRQCLILKKKIFS